ncbi:unnamed protein product [Trichobilharzia regenti]|nr:unnamed protein product [Trichobilharzia regenti]
MNAVQAFWDNKIVHINCAISHNSSNDNNNGLINNKDEKVKQPVITRIMKSSMIKQAIVQV